MLFGLLLFWFLGCFLGCFFFGFEYQKYMNDYMHVLLSSFNLFMLYELQQVASSSVLSASSPHLFVTSSVDHSCQARQITRHLWEPFKSLTAAA